MTMEKRGVIDENTPSGTCCGGKAACGSTGEVGEAGIPDNQMLLKFGQSSEPSTEKEADDMESSSMADAIDAVVEETDKDAK